VALIGIDTQKVGWQIDDAVVVQSPTFEQDPDTWATFDWADSADAINLTNAVKERFLAAGVTDFSALVDPDPGSDDAGRAATFAALQAFFTNVQFGNVVDDADNTATATSPGCNAVGYLSWFDKSGLGDILDDAALFEAFCISAGLTDGGGNYGFRYATNADAAGEPLLQYPNSTRVCQSGDLRNVPELLEDMVAAIKAIEHVAWAEPGNMNRFGRKFSWGDGNAEEGYGDSSAEYDPSFGWHGDPSVPHGDAAEDFAATTSEAGSASPVSYATTESTHYADSAASELLVKLTSSLEEAAIVFTPQVAGPYAVRIKAATVDGGDSFHTLGSSLTNGWSSMETGSGATADTEEKTDAVGATEMDTDWFQIATVPPISITLTLAPDEAEGDEPFDWEVAATVKVGEEEISGNNAMQIDWSGDLTGVVGDEYTGEKPAADAGEYTGNCTAIIYEGTDAADTDEASASCTVNEVTTTTTTGGTTTTTTTGTTTTGGTTTTTTGI
jgi:hypothetical protein